MISYQISFLPNANEIITKKLYEKSTAAFFKSLITDVNCRYQTHFATDMQSYVTRIGIITSSVVIAPKFQTEHTYLNAIDYLCNDILKDKYLCTILKGGIEINDGGNAGKHSIKNVEVNIEECVRQYNRLIKSLVNSGLTAYHICFLKLNKLPRNNSKDSPIFVDEENIKYGVLSESKYSVQLESLVTFDPYDKSVNIPLTIRWQCNLERPYYVIRVSAQSSNDEFKSIFDSGYVYIKDEENKHGDFYVHEHQLHIHESYFIKRKVTVTVNLWLAEGSFFGWKRYGWQSEKLSMDISPFLKDKRR